MDDLDFPFSHWVIYNIPPTATSLEEGIIGQPQLADGTLQGINDNEIMGYIGPFPPTGETHRYAFILYALDTILDVNPGAKRERVIVAMEGHVLGKSELIGTYVGILP
jgi:Raf kinase inhibitor-like YbhB/YbcL family protein